MIKELSDMPAGVIGFEVTGTLRAEDYRDVVLMFGRWSTEVGMTFAPNCPQKLSNLMPYLAF